MCFTNSNDLIALFWYHLTISGREKLIRWENPFCSEREGSACEGAIEDRHAERDQRENALDS